MKTQGKTKNINKMKERWKDKSLHASSKFFSDPSVASFVGSEI